MEETVGDFIVRVQRDARREIHPVTVPILEERGGFGSPRPEIHGTGVLLSVGGARFLISAAHVLRPKVEHGKELFVPTSETEAEDLEGLFVLPPPTPAIDNQSEPTESIYDIAAARLSVRRADAFEQLGMRFLPATQTYNVNPTSLPGGGYVLYGYPAKTNWQGRGTTEPYAFSCAPYIGSTAGLRSYDSSVHGLLGFNLQNMVNHQTREKGRLPISTDGTSGSGVWWYYSEADLARRAGHVGSPLLVGIHVGIQTCDPAVKKFVPVWYALAFIYKCWPELRRDVCGTSNEM